MCNHVTSASQLVREIDLKGMPGVVVYKHLYGANIKRLCAIVLRAASVMDRRVEYLILLEQPLRSLLFGGEVVGTEAPLHGLDEDLNIPGEAPLIDVDVVDSPHPLLDRGVAAQANDLGQAREADPHAVAVGVVVRKQFAELFYKHRPLWPGTSKRHIAADDIDQLGDLVE